MSTYTVKHVSDAERLARSTDQRNESEWRVQLTDDERAMVIFINGAWMELDLSQSLHFLEAFTEIRAKMRP